jgi:hypothetical protein
MERRISMIRRITKAGFEVLAGGAGGTPADEPDQGGGGTGAGIGVPHVPHAVAPATIGVPHRIQYMPSLIRWDASRAT